MNIQDLLDEVKEKNNLPSDYAAAQLLDAKTQETSRWRNGLTYPGPYHCAQIAKATSRSTEEVLAIVGMEKEKNPDRREFWRKLAGAAAITYVCVGVSFFPGKSRSSAVFLGMGLPNNVYYVKSWLDSLRRDLLHIFTPSRWIESRTFAR